MIPLVVRGVKSLKEIKGISIQGWGKEINRRGNVVQTSKC